MPKLKDVRFGEQKKRSSQTTMRLDRDVANVMRRLASHERKPLSQLLSDMLSVYCAQKHPDLTLVFEDEQP